jgi:hypothetical protein
MKSNPLGKSVLTSRSASAGPVTRATVHARVRELAVMAGRQSSDVSQSDYEQARRELTGESDADRQDAILNALPETKRWDPVPGSEGHQALESPSDDEDEEGRSEAEQLVDAGAEEADRDRILQAARASDKHG